MNAYKPINEATYMKLKKQRLRCWDMSNMILAIAYAQHTLFSSMTILGTLTLLEPDA